VANKRETSSQRRARENRRRREALQARTQTAATPRPSRAAPAKPAGKASSTRTTDAKDTGATKARGGGRERIDRADRPGNSPVDVTTLEGGFYSRITHVPGGLQVLLAFAMSVLVTGMMIIQKSFVAAGAKKDAKPTQNVFEAYGTAGGLARIGPPLLLTIVALASAFRPRRRTVWNACLLLMGVVVIGGGAVGFFYLIPLGALGYASWKASKVEGPAPSLFGRNRAAGRLGKAGDEAAADADEAS
jgi:hypothetical protein